jgi:hypothetical protein
MPQFPLKVPCSCKEASISTCPFGIEPGYALMSCTLHDKTDIVLLHEVNGFNDMVNQSDVDHVWHVCTDLTGSLLRIKWVTTFVEEDGVHDRRWVGYTVKAMLRRDTESYRKV